jgi:hypothetical protein
MIRVDSNLKEFVAIAYDANACSGKGVLHAFFCDQRVKVSSKAANDNLYKPTE